MSAWLSAFFDEFEGRALQKTGSLSKEQLLQFFQHSEKLFTNPDFKVALRNAYHAGRQIQDLINQAQAKIFEDKVVPAVQGDFGLNSLQRVLADHGDDSSFKVLFYQFVQLEEKTMDEAELPPEQFEEKYTQLAAMQKAMEEQMKDMEAKTQGMSVEEKQEFMSNIYRTMLAQGFSNGQDACCATGCNSCQPPVFQAPPTQAPGVEELPSSRADIAAQPRVHTHGGPALSEQEQLAFFKTMAR